MIPPTDRTDLGALAPVTEDDPRFPIKAITSALSTTAALALSLGLDLPVWAVLVLTLVAAFGGAYVPPNPKRVKRAGPHENRKISHRGPRRRHPKP